MLTISPKKRPTATDLLSDAWITSKTQQTNDLLPEIRKGFNARNKFREAVEIVKLNNRIKKLKSLYGQDDESDTDIEEITSADNSLESLQQSLNNLSVKSPSSGDKTPEQRELKSALTQNAFAQIVRAATLNKERIMNYKEGDESK